MHRKSRLLAPVLACGLLWVLFPPDGLAQQPTTVGTNLSGLTDWSSEITFVDAFKTSRPWISGTRSTWEDGRPLDLDARGWVRALAPDQIARTVMFTHVARGAGHNPAGRYQVLYDGQGALEYGMNARRVESAPGRDVIEVDVAAGGCIGLFVTSVNPANYLRNLRVLLPVDAPAGEIFYPGLLEKIKRYRTIRFMDWMLGQVNNNIIQEHWSDRPLPEDARWSVKGAPVEVMVALANRLGADPWFTLSHLADDDYVRRFAQAVRAGLDPKLKVYVEHSNEVWNGQYPQAGYARERGLALGLSTNPYQAQIRYHARRSREIFAIFEEVFPRERLVRVLASQAANPWVSETALGFADTAAHTDALAIAPYFGVRMVTPEEQAHVQALDLVSLLHELEDTSIPLALDFTRRQVAVAQHFGVSLVAYEGGQHLVGIGPLATDPAVNALFDAANRDPRIGTLYTQYLRGWRDAGGGLFLHLTNCDAYTRYGRFGSLEYIDQSRAEAPKYDALQRFVDELSNR